MTQITGYRFGRLTQVDLIHLLDPFLIDFFFNFTL
jgi:hypothetical protein